MKMKSFATTAGAAALALAMWITPSATVQGQPLYDRIHVNLPYKIMLGEKILEPGEYTIQQLPSNGGSSRVLLFYTDKGMKFETSAMTIPALDINTARDTKVVLSHLGDDYFINKIWVQGKDYGYEIPIPKGLKERQNEKMTETTVAAQYQPTSETVKTETAEATTPPPVTTPTETKPAEEAQNTQPTRPVEAQPTQPVESQPAQPVETAAATPRPDPNANTADRAMAETPAPTSMPNTAANWLMLLLGGGTLSGAGLMLRRKQ